MKRVLVALLVAVGCADEGASSIDQQLSLIETEDGVLSGELVTERGTVAFSSRLLEPDVFETTLILNGLTLKAIIDYQSSAAEMDGFATRDGRATAMEDADRELIHELAAALATHDLGQDEAVYTRDRAVKKRPGVVLLRTLSSWVALSNSAPLERSLRWDNGRTVDTTCGAISGMGIWASHDCWDCWDYGDCWNWVNIGPTPDWSTGKPGPNSQICYTDANGCSANDHGQANGAWQYGDYFGRCDLSNIGQKYTLDCLRHDHCVRNGHVGASLYCDDEDGTNALDDITGYFDCPSQNGCYGACGGMGANGACWCDEACASYGDCCSDKLAYCGGSY